MNTHSFVLQDMAHRLRVATETAAVTIDEMAGATLAEMAALRSELRGYTLMVATIADQLHPTCSTVLPECLRRAGAGR